MKKLIARWETRGKRYWYELYQDDFGYSYSGHFCGGNIGNVTEGMALDHMYKKVADDAVIDSINMKRVF